MSMTMRYRGYDIKHEGDKGWRIYKDGKFVCAQPSLQFAQAWVLRAYQAETKGGDE